MTKLVFITGASSGIGQALAWRYYQAGYSLALVARRGAEIKSWADAQQISRQRCTVYEADVSDPISIFSTAQNCLAAQGLPDVVIANAGISVGMDTRQREDIGLMSQVFATNNVGMAATFQPFVMGMQERGHGTLVGIGSVAGVRGLPGHGAYCASKAAVISYCESLRGELKRSGIQVVTLSPGYIDTPLTRSNRYAMPFLMTPERFAEKAFQAISTGVTYRVIPWQMGLLGKLLRILPNWLFDKLLAGRARKHRQVSPPE